MKLAVVVVEVGRVVDVEVVDVEVVDVEVVDVEVVDVEVVDVEVVDFSTTSKVSFPSSVTLNSSS